MSERVLIVDCVGEELIAVLSEPKSSPDTAVVVIPGAPQYRVGSHRQFVLLARRIACEGFAVLRFDPRGRGDSAHSVQAFDRLTPDIRAALDALQTECPSVRAIVLWGLCDAASAALLYYRETADVRVRGIVLVNPWIRSESTLARTHLKHHYARRLIDWDFWRSVTSGRRRIFAEFKSLVGVLRKAANGLFGHASGAAFQTRMAEALEEFAGSVLIVLSEHDWTAKEFVEHWSVGKRWPQLLRRPNIECAHLAGANHTCSSRLARHRLETVTLGWLARKFQNRSTLRTLGGLAQSEADK